MSMPALRVALYARVSSDQQTEQGTIASQVAALEARILQDGLPLEPDNRFIAIGLGHPIADRLGRGFKLASQIGRVTPGTNQLDHLAPELRRIGRMRLGHKDTSRKSIVGVHQTGATSVCRQVRGIPVAPRRGACALSDFPSLAWPSPSPDNITSVLGECPFLSRLSRPGIGTEQRSNR